MQRRSFLLSLVLLGVSFGAGNSEAITPSLKKRKFLKAGNSYYAEKGSEFILPDEAKDGDEIFLAIDGESLKDSASIYSNTATISGEKEHLILDTMANVRFSFDSLARNWKIS